MADHIWDEVIYLGDLMDFDYISKFSKENIKLLSGKRFKGDYDYANQVLDRHQKLAPGAKFTLIEGNHDWRVRKLIEKDPMFEGLVELPENLRLKERGIKFVPFWNDGTIYKVGKAHFVHGKYTNDAHAKKMASNYGVPIFYGHTHDVQVYSKVMLGKDKTVQAASLGCLCDPQAYMRGGPDNWQQCFGVFHIRDDGFFNYYLVQIFKHSFISPEGKHYS